MLILKVEGEPGDDLRAATVEAWMLAQKLQLSVHLDFNGKTIVGRPETALLDLLDAVSAHYLDPNWSAIGVAPRR